MLLMNMFHQDNLKAQVAVTIPKPKEICSREEGTVRTTHLKNSSFHDNVGKQM